MFLEPAEESDGVSHLYDGDLRVRGFVMNLTRLWAWRPDVSEAFLSLRTQLTSNSSLSDREIALIISATASTLGDSYCSLVWGKNLASLAEPSLAVAVLNGCFSDTMTARERALATWVRKVVDNPSQTTAADVDELRAAGFSDKEIFEATAFSAFRLAFATVNDALGAQPDWQAEAAAPAEIRSAVAYGRRPAGREE